MENNSQICIYCKRNNREVPLINLSYQDQVFSICPQHLPILIHEPAKLVHLIPGSDLFGSVDTHHDH